MIRITRTIETLTLEVESREDLPEVERYIGTVPLPTVQPPTSVPSPTPSERNPNPVRQPGPGQSMPEQAEKAIRRLGRWSMLDEIAAEAQRDPDFYSEAKDPRMSILTALRRNKGNVFRKSDTGLWGLAEWDEGAGPR